MAKPLCVECSAAMLKMLDERIGRILEAGRTDAEYREVGQSHCFHLMEIKQIIEGKAREESMSGKTRCKWCQQKESAHSAGMCPVAIHMMFEPVAEPTPPEGEAVPEQSKLAQNLSFLEAAPEEIARMDAAITDKYMRYAAPVVSTAAPEPPPIVLHCQECHELITFNGSYNQWFHADGTSTYPKCTRPKAVAPESYKPAEGPGSICLKCGKLIRKTSWIPALLGECDCENSPAATPVTVEAPGKCHPDCVTQIDYITKYSRPDLRGKPCDCGAATPKPIGDVEAAAKTLYEKGFRYEGPVIFACEFGVTAESAQIETIAAILSPFFAPAGPPSQLLEKLKPLTVKDGTPGVSLESYDTLWRLLPEIIAALSAQLPCSECATLRKERDGLRDENYMLRHAPKGCSFCGEIQGHTAECWTVKTVDRLSASEAQLSTLGDALRGMLESYDLLIEQAQSHFKSETFKGVIEGAFIGEITRARKLLAPTPEVAKEGKL